MFNLEMVILSGLQGTLGFIVHLDAQKKQD